MTRTDIEKAFKNKGVRLDIHNLDTDGGWGTCYDNISKDELLDISYSLDYPYTYLVSDPIKSVEIGYYVIVTFKSVS